MQLTCHLNGHLNPSYLIPQSTIFGFLDISNKGIFHCKLFRTTI